MNKKRFLISTTISLFLVLVIALFFWLLGGKSLLMTYRNYLSKDIPGKIYSYQDFRDRGPSEMLHGYYAGADDGGFYMWTLSGLKRFSHKPNISVYQYVDPCGLVKQLKEASEAKTEKTNFPLDEGIGFDFDKWVSLMKRGDYVWVKRVGGEDDKVIDKVLGNSSNTYPMTTITEQSCE